MKEGAPAAVLPGKADRESVFEKRGIREVLRHAPVDRHLPLPHQAPVGDDLLDAGVELEVRRDAGQLLREHLQVGQGQRGVVVLVPLRVPVARPVNRERRLEIREDGPVGVIAPVERLPVGGDHLVGILRPDQPLSEELVRVELARAGMLVDDLVHQRLGDHRLILLVVAELAEAHEVDHHVLLELGAVIEGDLGRHDHGLRVVAVHVEDRRLDHLHDIGAIEGRAAVARVRGREADLVVQHDMHGAPGAVAARLRQVQGFHDHALAGDRRVAVDQHRQHLLALAVLAAVLARPHRALDHRVHDLEMRRIEGERQVHRPAGRIDVGRESLVILHVAGEQRIVVLALEFREQILRHLAERVHQHVQPAAVGHAEHELLHPGLARALQKVVEHRDHRVTAFERKTLLPDIARVQESLETFGRGEPLEDMALVVRRIARLRPDRLQPLLDPVLLHATGEVHVFDAESAAVGLLQCLDDFAQARLLGADERSSVEHRVHVGLGQIVVGGLELGDVRALPALQGIDVGDEHPAEAVLRDQLQHRNLLAIETRHGGRRAGRAGPGKPGEGFDDRRVGHVAPTVSGCRHRLQLVEILAPLLGDRLRVGEVSLVQLFDEGRVGAEEIRIGEEFLHGAHI